MATQKQSCANPKNAKKSTGPRTPEGKAASRRNPVTHGAYARPSTLTAEEREASHEFRTAIVADLAPVGVMESEAAEAIAWTMWRRHRLRTKEEAVMVLDEERRKLRLHDERMRRRWSHASRERPSALETMATDEEIAERDAMRDRVQVLEAMTGPSAPQIEECLESYASAETHLQLTVQRELATYYALKDRRGAGR